MGDIITLLPDHVANQIAAGEVVQRPASVVKELMENAIDAGSTHVQLIIKEAGKVLIQVVDNGKGMSVTDARMAFERHATSKIKAASDLFALNTKGFRGEALASIAAVAHVEMLTKTAVDEVATQIKIAGSEIQEQEPIVAPQGTSIAVKNLFFNIPARRNFLKSNTVELRHIIDEFHRVALAHPQVAFTFFQGGQELFDLPAANLRKRIVHIFGSKIDEKLVPVEESTSVSSVSGFVIKPNAAKRTRGQQFFFVNDRFIKSPFMHHAIMNAYEGLLVDGTVPGYFIFFNLDPQTIDINIHPTKTEVKFEDEQSLYAILRSCVKHSLGMFNVAPTLDFERDPNLDTPYRQVNQSAGTPQLEVDSSFNPFKNPDARRFSKPNESSWESLYVEVESQRVSSSLGNELNATPDYDTVKVFQLMNRYIVSSIGSALLLIDQQRAHERILYEQFLKTITQKKTASQQLLFPYKLELNPTQQAFLSDLEEVLVEAGFIFERDSNTTIIIKGIPSSSSEKEIPNIFENLFNSLESDLPADSFSQSDVLSKSLAKTLSIKRGVSMKPEEQQRLLDDLFACKETQVSPFNRQIFVTLTQEELDKKFT
ncbi:MAG: DNA mismatch repair endonuclease MutL [Flavobacteriales bacterium]|jgi:DNA mismatch repair protein MutL|nr:DNA mismatch repair endonuclease MutL [Flavobacteriaceae bacterium]MDO7582296.1 DNA mismatch repair endonuclease MutL [Flavobacteriaceae bacterium]MDO7592401.1 DNA mismatch repair endonuclease MutL [Flavobacteriaceae bacterium]MDO7598433.1 DNA mismatch repair endonuclease MutL [Flavobacteriaceae bacterium]MDO7603369.1 DNA mismatch repair endonuclease MutL [Flavobacteriaceae bacterium]|tara:strand:- start:1643 stop:3436 length:1794 start_codon:yes stop_codon:yes gene_type:complete